MRKKSASKVYRDLEVDVEAALTLLGAALAKFPREGDRSMLSTMTFQHIYVAFERFLSDLIVAYVNNSPARFAAETARRVTASVDAKHGPWLAGIVSMGFPDHLSVADVENALDPSGRSITFATTAALIQFASVNLSPHHARRFATLHADDCALLDAARAIRHHISHRSPASRIAMNAAIADLSGNANAGLKRNVNEIQVVGAYLRASIDGRTRVNRFGKRLLAIASQLSR